MKKLFDNLTENSRHAEFISASQITPHPNPVFDLLVISLAIYECAFAFTLCSLVLHAHRVSQSCCATKGSICSLSGLVSLRPSANPLSLGEGTKSISPLPLGEGRILNERASCKNSGEGVMHGAEGTIFTAVGAILSMSLRRSCRRLKQSSLCFILNGLPRPHFVRPRNDKSCHSERIEESQVMSLRSGFGNIFILPYFLRNLKSTPLLSLRDTLSLGEGTKYQPLLWGKARGEGKKIRYIKI